MIHSAAFAAFITRCDTGGVLLFKPILLTAALVCVFSIFVSAQDAASPAAELVTVTGRIAREGKSLQEVENGRALFIEPVEDVLISIEPDDEPSTRGEISIPQGLDIPKIYLAKQGRTHRWEVTGGNVIRFHQGGVLWRAPFEPGTHKISALLTDESAWSRIKPDQRILAEHNILGAFAFYFIIMHPFDSGGQGVIEGYPIGIYPDEKDDQVLEPVFSRREAYRPPSHFIRINSDNIGARISRHFTLGDFSPADEKDKTHFIALDPDLPVRLDNLVDALKDKGLRFSGLKILRSYLTPNKAELYRRQGIDVARFSRLLYGDSAVFIIDENNDGLMDDLNGDGQFDRQDFSIIEQSVEEIEAKTHISGGLGYSMHFKDPVHKDTPCIQIDVRGWRSRWSDDPAQ